MQIMTKTMSGKHSFRGLGFIAVNGLPLAICGSRIIDCGKGSQLKWVQGQLEQVPVEPELRATILGSFDYSSYVSGHELFTSLDGKYRLYIGLLEGHPLGADASSTGFAAMPPLRFTFTPLFPRGGIDLDGIYNIIDPAVGDGPMATAMYVNLIE